MDENENKADRPEGVELEARIVAWISGEASAFEIAELERLLKEKPELAVFKRRIEAVRDLVGEAVRQEKEPLKLSGEAREKLLRTIGVPPSGAPAEPKKEEESVLAVYGRRPRTIYRWMMAAAACLVCALLFVTMLTPSFQQRRSYQSEAKETVQMPVEREAKAARSLAGTTGAGRGSLLGTYPGPLQKTAPALAALSGKPQVFEDRAHFMDELNERASAAPILSTAPTDARQLAAASSVGKGVSAAASESLPSLGSSAENPAALDESAKRSVAGLGEHSLNSLDSELGAQGHQGQNPNVGAPTLAQINPASDVASSEETPASAPFVVNGTEDDGSYKANSSLAGTRIRTDLKDAGSDVTVATAQSLQDIDAKKQEELLTYRPGTDAGGAHGTVPVDSGAISSQTTASAATRVRGANEPARALSDFPADLFDVGRVNLKTAPNPVLLGSGALVGSSNGHLEKTITAAPSFGAEDDASKNPISTFSLHVGDVSFRLAADALARGEMPDPAQIRPEEFYNALDYGDPMPDLSELISCRIEQAADPLRQQRNLVRIAMRVPAAGHAAGQPLRLTVLLDTSGSMEREDRASGVHKAMEALASLLGANDRVTLIGFARQPRLIAESLPGDQAGRLVDLVSRTPAEGGTNLEEALRLGGDLARRQHLGGAQNRIVVLTDGATNLGNADPARLAAIVASLRQEGIAFDACGVGIDGVNDEVLEALTRKGGGRYYLVTTPESADAGFARQLAGAFRPAAENVKVQVRFNPARVGHYRLIGFEKNRLREQDFRNDKVGAAALAAGEDAVAVYEVEALPQGEGELGEVYVRFRVPATGAMVERSWTLPYEPYAPSFDHASPTLQLAGTAAFVAEKLQGAPEGGIRLAPLVPVVNSLRGRYPDEARVQTLVSMFEQLRRLEKD
jgi:hypothetical protein